MVNFAEDPTLDLGTQHKLDQLVEKLPELDTEVQELLKFYRDRNGSDKKREQIQRIQKEHKTTARKLRSYKPSLRMTELLLENKTVVNVGSGKSALQPELDALQIPARIFDIDLKAIPYENLEETTGPSLLDIAKYFLGIRERRLRKNLEEAKHSGKKDQADKIIGQLLSLVEKRKKLRREGNPNFMVANALHLPMADKSVDIAISLQATYQLDNVVERLMAYDEMMRVAKTSVHVGAVYGEDWELLKALAEKNNFEMIFSQPYSGSDFELRRPEKLSEWIGTAMIAAMRFSPVNPLMFSSESDYYAYWKKFGDQFINPPKDFAPGVKKRFGRVVSADVDSDKGSTIILVRKDRLKEIEIDLRTQGLLDEQGKPTTQYYKNAAEKLRPMRERSGKAHKPIPYLQDTSLDI